jgi:hypothetical protein
MAKSLPDTHPFRCDFGETPVRDTDLLPELEEGWGEVGVERPPHPIRFFPPFGKGGWGDAKMPQDR